MESEEERLKLLEWMKKRLEELENEILAIKAAISFIESASGQINNEQKNPPEKTIQTTEAEPPKKIDQKPVPQQMNNQVNAQPSEVPTTQITIGEKKVAAIFQHDNEMKVDVLVPLSQDTPPFKSFFVEKVLKDYEKKDKIREQEGQMQPNQILTYEIINDENNNIKQIKIKNINDQRRIREIISTIRWTIARMIEKEGGY
ncbi:MAG: hypothetical protein ACP5T2_02715 [Thermoprotei archaeon]